MNPQENASQSGFESEQLHHKWALVYDFDLPGTAGCMRGRSCNVVQFSTVVHYPHQVMEHNLLPTAWIISNKQPFGGQGENDPGVKAKDSLLMASPNYIARFITTTKRAMSCCITRIGPGACAETAEVAGRLMHHLETVLEQRLRILVCDFTRDDRGRLWFLQVFSSAVFEISNPCCNTRCAPSDSMPRQVFTDEVEAEQLLRAFQILVNQVVGVVTQARFEARMIRNGNISGLEQQANSTLTVFQGPQQQIHGVGL